MTTKELYNKVVERAKAFGMKSVNKKEDTSKESDKKGNAVIRNNTNKTSFADGKAYFGLINANQKFSSTYSDFSFVVFPDAAEDDEVKKVIVGLVTGSEGFADDMALAVLPWTRRSFLKLSLNDGKSFFKNSFADIETKSADFLEYLREHDEYKTLAGPVKKFAKYLPAVQIVDLDDDENRAKTIIDVWLATYASIREWITKDELEKALQAFNKIKDATVKKTDELDDIRHLLDTRKYIVLQGAPGCGKTYTALKIAEDSTLFQKYFFEQFHAETTYSDFVCGLEPDTSGAAGRFRVKTGKLCKAMEYATAHPDKKVVLIIDEINRANLSNVLGPVFYLFEYQSGKRHVEIDINGRKYTSLPRNLYVIATMNTADRSLAVVDFALRRRFAWYTLKPHAITPDDESLVFDKDLFNEMAEIFERYASDAELSLQPGQSYFIFKKGASDDEKKERLTYELLPLIKEYLTEGYLQNASNAFSDFFLKNAGKQLYE